MLFLLSSSEGRISKNIILSLAFRKQILRKCYPHSYLKEVDSLKTLFFILPPESKLSKNIILSLVFWR